jgi:hypothetical protein
MMFASFFLLVPLMSNPFHASQSSNRSLTHESGTEFFDAEATKQANSPQFQQPAIEPVSGIIAKVSGQ